ncbi:HNH endonuclease [Methylobacterium oxalidis]|uniref:HNH nuclease domain-containing protein n=1 Tax=Methylobacterium oxalidis TaxID=944322 RepID=A0A512IX37_9HYPH|nr:HNH endonuclease [Methylobacterium oxalidis]GEP02288.1 hypothetical protein MOX02_03260 [Methylobacterium oxalidis]GJE32278.1 hypothetical protein LDDCCGHA_2464 [Methylobacterium oxalidis]GLS62233.1 hypothetical protein GCM10007888_06140 [Methylobacterium oxalidis]
MKHAYTHLTQDYLAQILQYDPDTGVLTWLKRPLEQFKKTSTANSWNAKYAGKPALTAIGAHGYKQGKIDGQTILAHRAIWTLMTDERPPMIDHRDGVKTNNTFKNLRPASKVENARNQRGRNCRQLPKGVEVCRVERYRARARLAGKKVHLGIHDTVEEARLAYINFAIEAHGEFYNPDAGVSLLKTA